MPPSNPLSPERPEDSRFLGVCEELCFVAAWLPRGRHGYASLLAKEFNRQVGAHRLAVKLLIGPLKGEDMVLHRCGNSRCHNPYHLYVGGDAENLRDRILHRDAREHLEPLAATDERRTSTGPHSSPSRSQSGSVSTGCKFHRIHSRQVLPCRLASPNIRRVQTAL